MKKKDPIEEISSSLNRIYYMLAIIAGIMLVSYLKCNAQDSIQWREKPPGAIYLAWQPSDMGLGIRGDVHATWWLGFYGSASYGQWYLYKWSGLDKHFKGTLGVLVPWKDWKGNQHDWSIGLNYHWVSGEVIPSDIFHDDPRLQSPWSFEVGLTIKMPRFTMAFRTDVIRWEPCFDIGIPLRRKR